ncbi:helix-turn-helix domain-containing protein [Latilactobacillus sakei]
MIIPVVNNEAGRTLRKLRIDRGMSQVALATKLGLKSSQHLWNIEHETNPLTLEMVDKASRILNVSPNVFLREKVKQNI